MELPLGEGLLFAVAFLLAAAGAVQIGVAITRRFREHLSPEVREARWVNIVGALGYGARGVVFLVAAWLLFRAGIDHSPSQAGAVGDALRTLPGAVATLVAAGLGLFGIYSLIEARYRIIPDPQVERRVADAVA
jgi:hypothetical protein